MKKIVSYFIIIYIASVSFIACKKMDATYREFIVPGGITYPAKAAPIAYSGRNRVKISWLRGSDPSVTKAVIYWDYYADSVVVDIPPTGDTISTVINNLPEKSYTFIVKTYDSKGNASVPVELLCDVYGSEYQAGLLNRLVNTATINAQGKVTVKWAAAYISGGAYATEVQYKDSVGHQRTQYVPASDSLSVIPDIMRGTTFQCRTIYIPDSLSIDTFYTPFQENKQYVFDKSDWRVIAYSSQYRVGANEAVWVINGDPATGWFPNKAYVFPQYVTIDMGYQNVITKFDLYRIQGDERSYTTFQLLVSNDNMTWTDLGVFNFDRTIDGPQPYDISSHPKARYFKFIGLTGGPANGYTGLGEITVYGF